MGTRDPLAQGIRDAEDERILFSMRFETLLHELQRFRPTAFLTNSVHDEVTIEGVDPNDPHVKVHLDAYAKGVPADCDDPVCLVHEVHEL